MTGAAGPGGELERLRREAAHAERRYNDALTAVDRSLRRLPGFPHAPPAYDDTRLARVRELAAAAGPPAAAGSRLPARLRAAIWRVVAPALERQQAFNLALTEHLDRNAAAHREASKAAASTLVVLRDELEALGTFQSRLVQCLQEITPVVDTRHRLVEAQLAELRASLAVAQRAATAATRELTRLAAAAGGAVAGAAPGTAAAPAPAPIGDAGAASFKYVAFEDCYRGSADDIRGRLQDYVPLFEGHAPVLELGCGRGEFLQLLRERGIPARGIDANREMAAICRAQGIEAEEGDALAHLDGLAGGSLGGLFGAQVVEHMEPGYLLRLLDAACEALRPGGILVLETINPACWVAFFESYIRDPTHVRPLHPDTLKFLLIASGFGEVDVRFRSPVAAEAKLQTVPEPVGAAAPLATELAAVVSAFNANVRRLNERLFTHMDYAVVGHRL